MNHVTVRSPGPNARLFAVALLAAACGDDSNASPAAAGAAGSAGVAGSAGAAGSAGTPGSGGSGGVPDPLKNCEPGAPAAVPPLQLTQLVSGLERPTSLMQAPGDSERLFVLEKPGRIRILRGGATLGAPFLSVQGVSERFDEMGLLGLAFHPDYANNGRFYVYYSTLLNQGQHYNRLSEYRVSTGNPDLADAASERVLLQQSWPQDNHNGGPLAFGPDGFLYVGMGDGGGANDQHGASGNGQDLGTWLGKILRIDVDGAGAGGAEATGGAPAPATLEYGIPAGNLATAGALPELWSYGLRNPWRFSFDPCTGDMYIGDVGQNEIEEVDFEPFGAGGRNYGWRLMEGERCFNPATGCNAAQQNLVLPIAQYDHEVGVSVTGGHVYRGSSIPALRGWYVYADYDSARFFTLRMQGGQVASAQTEITDDINPGRAVRGITSFGEDAAGNLYVLSYAGAVYRIDAE